MTNATGKPITKMMLFKIYHETAKTRLNCAFKDLDLLGTCPCCGYPALNFAVDDQLTLSWSCFNGCNP